MEKTDKKMFGIFFDWLDECPAQWFRDRVGEERTGISQLDITDRAMEKKIPLAPEPLKKLNLGCKKGIREGYINLDILPFKGVNVQHDLNKFPYPFADNYFDEIICRAVLEQLDDWQKVIKELHRISKNKAKWIITVPYYNSVTAFNPYNKHFFTPDSFNMYDKKRMKEFYKPFRKSFYEIKNFKLIPSSLGRFVPPRLRNFIGMMFGNLVSWIIVEIEVIKQEGGTI